MNEQAITQFFVQTIGFLLRIFLNCVSFPVSILLRRNMGERYCTYTKAIIAYLFAIWSFAIFGHLPSISGTVSPIATKIQTLFSVIYWMFFIINRLEIRERQKKGIHWHSFYIGSPRFLADTHVNQKFVLPLIAFVLSIILSMLSKWIPSFFSVLILLSALGMFLEYVLLQHKARMKYLDAVDMDIESNQLSKTLKGEPPENTQGYFIPNVFSPAEREKEGETRIAKMYAALDPKLKDLIQEPK